MFFRILLLTVLAVPGKTATYNFTDAEIRIDTLSSGSLYYYGLPSDTCRKMIVRNAQLYHISTLNVY